MSKNIGKLIAEHRKEKGITQEELAEHLGVSTKTISRWERGLTDPDVSFIGNLSKYLDISIVDLLPPDFEFHIDKKGMNELIINTIKLYDNYKKKYIKKTKKQILMLFIVFLSIAILGSFATYHLTKDKYITTFYNLDASLDKYQVSGHIIENKKHTIIAINHLDLSDAIANFDEIKTEALSIEISSKGQLLLKNTYEQDEETLLKNLLNEYSSEIVIEQDSEEYTKFAKENISIEILYGKNLHDYERIDLLLSNIN